MFQAGTAVALARNNRPLYPWQPVEKAPKAASLDGWMTLHYRVWLDCRFCRFILRMEFDSMDSKRIGGPLALTLLSCSLLLAFVVWVELAPASMHSVSYEDGPIEMLSAVFYGLSSICFFVFIFRSQFLKSRTWLHYTIPLGWALLMFVFFGEELSWGQRIFSYSTPESLAEINVQNEFNIHNIGIVDTFMGGKFRYLSIMMLTTGLLLPLLGLTRLGKRMIQATAFPVVPFCYAPLFVGAFLFGKYYYPVVGYVAAEVRELLMGIAMFLFGLHGSLNPRALFRLPETHQRSGLEEHGNVLTHQDTPNQSDVRSR